MHEYRDDKIKVKISATINRLNELTKTHTESLEYMYSLCDGYKDKTVPDFDKLNWNAPNKYQQFESYDSTFWVKLVIPPKKEESGRELRFSVRTGREGQWDATNPQMIVYHNGVNYGTLDMNHTWLPLEWDRAYELYVYVHTGMENGYISFEPSLYTADLITEALMYDIKVPRMCMDHLDMNDFDYNTIRFHLDKACIGLDLRVPYSKEYYDSLIAGRKYLKEEFYQKVCSDTNGVVNVIGHTHIDIAWMWTVKQTREKAQRSFKTASNLINRYDDYLFMSSQPQLYEFVKEDDPKLYSDIKKHISDKKWEAEGAMWLEADTNLISGESLVRQILFGKKFFGKEFGVESKVLWLPDVFGYSGALPQILKKCGVDNFFTTKLHWNDTNVMPDDVFEWEGIDGSKVFSVMSPVYAQPLSELLVKRRITSLKNKSCIHNLIYTMGYADGGGGTTCEMMEIYERMKYGIPGYPKVKMSFAMDAVEKIKDEFYQNTTVEYTRPKWTGEIYLEAHRGTYTSVSDVKKNNRLSEMLSLSAETVSVADSVLLGGEYPEEDLKENQKVILLNQFHDIIPGSSIKEVYDVCDKEYEDVLSRERNIIDTKLSSIRKNLSTQGGLFVYNPSPYTATQIVECDGKHYLAENIPSHGWKVIKEDVYDISVDVGDYYIENDVIKVTFDKDYHIISIYDKKEEREIIKCGEAANKIVIYEDLPYKYDNWNIDEYHFQKSWVWDNVEKIQKLKNGIRIYRKFLQSTLVQDVVINNGSKKIDFITKIDWHQEHLFVKAEFQTDIRCDEATYEIQFGHIKRPSHKNTLWDRARFEVCAHKWMDMSEDGYGVALINDCKYGHSAYCNKMTLSLIKCGTYPASGLDEGEHNVVYSFMPHTGNFKEAGVIRESYILNTPFVVDKVTKTEGHLPDTYSLIGCDKESVVIETIKKAEDDDSVIVRMYESFDGKVSTNITAGFDFKEVYFCDMLENNISKLESDGRSVKVNLRNFEIVTLKFVV